MFSFFDKLPAEIILKIFSESCRQDQARLAQVCKEFNQITQDGSLELPKYKSGNKQFQVGDVCLNIRSRSSNLFILTSAKNGQRMNCTLFLSQEDFIEIVKTIKEGTLTLISKLNSMKMLAASLIANALQQEFDKENKKTYSN